MINNDFEKEILNQPNDMRATISFVRDQYKNIKLKGYDLKRLIFVGSGDSYIAPQALFLLISKYFDAHLMVLTPMEVFNYSFGSDDLIVLISFSGESKQLIETQKFLSKTNCETVSITFNSNNSIAKSCNYNFKIPIKSNRLTPHATDYMNTLLAIALFVERTLDKEFLILNKLPLIVNRQIEDSFSSLKKISKKIFRSRNYFFLGSGYSYGSCQYASAKLWEVGGIQSISCKLDEFPHGMHLMANKKDSIFIICNKKNNNNIDDTFKILKKIYNKIFIITNSTKVNQTNRILLKKIDEEWNPFLEAIIIQLICLFVANNNKFDVIKKDGINKNFKKYNEVHNLLVR